jgi:hypothetical protein
MHQNSQRFKYIKINIFNYYSNIKYFLCYYLNKKKIMAAKVPNEKIIIISLKIILKKNLKPQIKINNYFLITNISKFINYITINKLVGFGRACAPVRATVFLDSLSCKTGALRAPPPIAASLLLIYPPKLSLRPELGPSG